VSRNPLPTSYLKTRQDGSACHAENDLSAKRFGTRHWIAARYRVGLKTTREKKRLSFLGWQRSACHTRDIGKRWRGSLRLKITLVK
jgi:hypothetical protein